MDSEKPNMVNVFLFNQEWEVLLINNIKHNSNRWEMPGGKVMDGLSLEECAVLEPYQELGIKVRLNGIFGDYKTQTPEGLFLCRTYFAEIVDGTPKIMEPKNHRTFGYFNYKGLLKLKEEGTLAPNLISALKDLRNHID